MRFPMGPLTLFAAVACLGAIAAFQQFVGSLPTSGAHFGPISGQHFVRERRVVVASGVEFGEHFGALGQFLVARQRRVATSDANHPLVHWMEEHLRQFGVQ